MADNKTELAERLLQLDERAFEEFGTHYALDVVAILVQYGFSTEAAKARADELILEIAVRVPECASDIRLVGLSAWVHHQVRVLMLETWGQSKTMSRCYRDLLAIAGARHC
jgi:hypothetical protein